VIKRAIIDHTPLILFMYHMNKDCGDNMEGNDRKCFLEFQ
jgi:hypothetical protein